ncbi:hypothetical protein B4168_1302 [Anoxybacillus flavithermus]|nr:hypothetical protein B4168_1302 [Anoxybacillus flavithermus]OAO83665.1 hypothetical protein GT23_4159 [Parageobacillus thermoglucosidasius]
MKYIDREIFLLTGLTVRLANSTRLKASIMAKIKNNANQV